MTDAPRKPPRQRRRRRRPGSSKKPAQPSAAQVIAQRAPVALDKPADVPLTDEEAARMRVHLAFLQRHRKLLNLKVNANEDLLLNGKRQPTHRGSCMHLLKKVSRSRVASVIPRMQPEERAAFLRGIVRFTTEFEFVLMYLEAVKDVASEKEAIAALVEALEQVDYQEVSGAQMRRLLELIAELFDDAQRPHLLLGLLSSRSFREALKRSEAALPDALLGIMNAVSAVQTAIHAQRAQPPTADLRRGLELLLATDERTLTAYPKRTRGRLLRAALEAGVQTGPALTGVAVLAKGLPPDHKDRESITLRLAGLKMSIGDETEAVALLERLVAPRKERADRPRKERADRSRQDRADRPRQTKESKPADDSPERRTAELWLRALRGRRIGGVGLTERRARRTPGFATGLHIRSQKPVWIRTGTPDMAERFESAAAAYNAVAAPSVAELIASGKTDDDQPFVVIPEFSHTANRGLPGDRSPAQVTAEGVRILWTVARFGWTLPRAELFRFAFDGHGRLWLTDILDAETCTVAEAEAQMLEPARSFVGAVYERAARTAVPASLEPSITAATNMAELLAALTIDRLR